MTAQATAGALLDAAEAEFAEHGIHGASLRSIMRSAGANTAAVHYHYGSREELAAAVLDRVLEPLQRRRLELLDAAVASSPTARPELQSLLDALVRPDFEARLAAGERDPRSARIVGAIYSRPPDFVRSRVEASFAPVARQFVPHLMTVLPVLSPQELSWRVRWNVFGMLGALLASDNVQVTNAETAEAEIARTVAAAAGALLAPPTEETSQ